LLFIGGFDKFVEVKPPRILTDQRGVEKNEKTFILVCREVGNIPDATVIKLKSIQLNDFWLNRLKCNLPGCDGVQPGLESKKQALVLGGHWSVKEVAEALKVGIENVIAVEHY
jgi:hypothetical protein